MFQKKNILIKYKFTKSISVETSWQYHCPEINPMKTKTPINLIEYFYNYVTFRNMKDADVAVNIKDVTSKGVN